MGKPLSVVEKLTTKLRALGFSQRKAETVAKALVPVARGAVKAEIVAKDKKHTRAVEGEVVEDTALVRVGGRTLAVTDQKIKVNGHFLRFDLPIAPMEGQKGIELLRVMHGLTSFGTYLVAAVKGDVGIVAVRDFHNGMYNVKFYPDMAFWGKDEEQLAHLGATDHFKREHYERMHFSRVALDQLMRRLAAEAKPKSRTKALLDRVLAVTTDPLVKAFGYLKQRKGLAA